MLAAAAALLGSLTGPYGLGASVLAILFGLLYRREDPGRLGPGIRFAAGPVLTAAVILLAAQIEFRAGDVDAVFAAGAAAAVGLVTTLVLARAFGLGSLGGLLAVGAAICGVSAMAAASRVMGHEKDLAPATTVVVLLGAVGLLALPATMILVPALDARTFGIVAGAVLPAVPQAVGAGFAGGGTVGGEFATLTKLTRVALLPLVLVGVAVARQRGPGRLRWPLEVTGFLALLALTNLVALPDLLVQSMAVSSRYLLLAALVAIGLQTQFPRAADLARPVLVVATALVAMALTALVVVQLH